MPYYLESVEYLPNGITGVLKYNSTFPFDSSTI